MNDLAAPFKQLVERRLWPVAVLLVAALAAVPMLLSHSADTSTGPIASTAVPADAGAPTEAIVSLAPADDAKRKVLGSPKNPFRPAIKARAAVKAKVAQDAGPASTPDAGTQVSGGTPLGSTPIGGAPSTPAAPVAPAVPTRTYELYSLFVRFGATDAGAPQLRNVERLKGLPGGTPAVVYLGLLGDHKTAVFLVGAGVKPQGDGRCEPTPEDCQTLRMKKGDVEFLDVPSDTAQGGTAQYELDLVKVVTKKTQVLSEAVAARAATAKGGRSLLRRNLSRVGNYRFDSRTGTLKLRQGDDVAAQAPTRKVGDQ